MKPLACSCTIEPCRNRTRSRRGACRIAGVRHSRGGHASEFLAAELRANARMPSQDLHLPPGARYRFPNSAWVFPEMVFPCSNFKMLIVETQLDPTY